MGVIVKLGSNIGLDMTDFQSDGFDLGDGELLSYSRTAIAVEFDEVRVVLKGRGFTYDDNGLKGGTVTGFEARDDGALVASVSGLNLSVKSIEKLVESGSLTALKAMIKGAFSGADDLYGGNASDVLLGYDGKDDLFGRAGGDTLYGGKGDDRITGGLGADRLYGEAGKDTFVYASARESTAGFGIDTIRDFTGKSGDRIDLTAIDAKAGTAKNDAFVFIGSKAFSGTAGELRVEKTASDTTVHADTNGDGLADFTLHFDDPMVMSKGFFLL